MADTNPNIKITAGTWINIYAQSGIPVGEQITVENIGVCDVYLAVSAAEPDRDHGAYNVLSRAADGILTNTQGDLGAWAYCNNTAGKINVPRTKAIAGFYPRLASDFNNGLGSGIKVDATGTQKVSNDHSVFHSYFTFDIPPTMWQIAEDDVQIPHDTSTRILSVDGAAIQSSGASPGNTSELISRRHPRYQPDRGLRWSASIGFLGVGNDGVLKAGLFVTGENGAYFKTKGDGKLYAVILSNGVETHETLITPPFTIDYTKGNIYKIQLLWHGVGPVRFYISNPLTGYPQLVHTYNFLNTLDEEPYFQNPALSATTRAENVTEEVRIWEGSVDISVEGGIENKAQYGSFTSTRQVSATQGLLAVFSPHTINGKVNTRDIRLVRVTVTGDKKSTVTLYRTRDPNAITGGLFEKKITGSFIEFNNTMTAVDTALMESFFVFKLKAGIVQSVANPDLFHIDFIVVHGDFLVLVLDAGSVVEVDTTVEIGEEI